MTPRAHALASSLTILGLALGAGLWWSTGSGPRPVVESRRIDAPAAPQARGISFTAREALERKVELGLTEAQARALRGLDREWQRTSGPIEAAARQAEDELQRFLEGAKRAGRANLEEIRHRAADPGELFAAYRAHRAAHAAAVRELLTEEQRARWAARGASQGAGERR